MKAGCNSDKVKHPAAPVSAKLTGKAGSRGATCSAGVALATQVESLRNPPTCPPKLSERRGKPRAPSLPVASYRTSGRRRDEQIRDAVRDAYSKIATQGGSCCGTSSSCCGSSSPEDLAKKIGYSDEELTALPDSANMGLSCGNPTALASLKPGEVVLDLGSGGGFDVFITARKVGRTGRVIGVDMTPEMISKARRNAFSFQEQTGLANAEFRLGEIEHLPVADQNVDVVISNCVINLSPDKPQVWREIARVLRPGGRAAVSDLALLKPLPEEIKQSVVALAGCVAGAVLVSETETMIKTAGLTDVTLTTKPAYIDSMTALNDTLYCDIRKHLPEDAKMSDYITSLYISAKKNTIQERENEL